MTKRYRAASKKKKVIEESLGLTGLAAALRRATLSDRVVGGATSTGWSARPSSSSPARRSHRLQVMGAVAHDESGPGAPQRS